MRTIALCLVLLVVPALAIAQDEKKESKGSIGGPEHNMEVYGVKIGMDIPTALQAVFKNANRKAGQERPDAMRKEGKKSKDIRVLYNDLPKGQLQIVFAGGKTVREITLIYKDRPNIESLRLASDSSIGTAQSGRAFDDRYSIGFVDRLKQEKLWWRDEKVKDDVPVRLSFRSGNIRKDGQLWWQTVAVKSIFVEEKNVKKFNKAYGVKY